MFELIQIDVKSTNKRQSYDIDIYYDVKYVYENMKNVK
jgi:hypothetical protein